MVRTWNPAPFLMWKHDNQGVGVPGLHVLENPRRGFATAFIVTARILTKEIRLLTAYTDHFLLSSFSPLPVYKIRETISAAALLVGRSPPKKRERLISDGSDEKRFLFPE